MNYLSNYIKNSAVVDFYCINIGSAQCREDVPENMQQFSSFFVNLWKQNKTCTIINIDSNFEDNYLLLKYYPDSIKIDNEHFDIYINDNITFIFIKEEINNNFNEINEFNIILDDINKFIMLYRKQLFVANFTGIINDDMENYFITLYKNTEYELLYNNYIQYNYLSDVNTCIVNMVKTAPIINNETKCILKLNNYSTKEIFDMYTTNIIQQTNINKYTILKHIHNKLYNITLNEICILRKKINNESIDNFINCELFKNIHPNVKFVIGTMKIALYDYLIENNNIIYKILDNKNINCHLLLIGQHLLTVNQKDIFDWSSDYNKFINNFHHHLEMIPV